jgi:hypothetical protein
MDRSLEFRDKNIRQTPKLLTQNGIYYRYCLLLTSTIPAEKRGIVKRII